MGFSLHTGDALGRTVQHMPYSAQVFFRKFPTECPLCERIQGWPLRVETVFRQPDQQRIDMRCHRCDYRWYELLALKVLVQVPVEVTSLTLALVFSELLGPSI
jgi:hypothetical protein